MKEFLQRELGFQILEVKKLSGYDNVNYLVKTAKYLHLNKKYLDDIPDPHESKSFTMTPTSGLFW